MRKFGLIGYPLGHSFSKKYFTGKFANEHLTDCSYENFPIGNISMLPDIIAAEQSLCGLNVTIPYKTAVIQYVDILDNEASSVGSVNVLKIKRAESGSVIYGYNSDVTGIRDSIAPYISGKIKNALVLGTGGASKAVCYTLKSLGISVIQVSRNAKPDAITYNDVNASIINKVSLIVNTTPLGMYPDISSRPDLNYNLIGNEHILFDLVYNPEMTWFLKEGKKRGATIIPGLKMLYSQAEKSWSLWNDLSD